MATLAASMAWDAAVSAQKGQTSGDPTVTVIDAKQTFIDSAQVWRDINIIPSKCLYARVRVCVYKLCWTYRYRNT